MIQHRQFMAIRFLQGLLDSFPEPVMVLNKFRQIVAGNLALANWLKRSLGSLLSLRPGEALSCVNWGDCPEGCGTGVFCRLCGAFQAIRTSQSSQEIAAQECRLTVNSENGPQSLDLLVTATPLPFGDGLTVFALRDISDQKRRQVLERVLFQEVLSTAGGLRGLLQIMPETGAPQREELHQVAYQASDELVEEIRIARDILLAEHGSLMVQAEALDAQELLASLARFYSLHRLSAGRILTVLPPVGWPRITTDPGLLRMVLGSLVANALEASQTGQTVTLRFTNYGAPVFSVHNAGHMPEDVQLQVFQRSFTTKQGKGRGIGAYYAQLITERYLHGHISFLSTPETGTTFTVTLDGPSEDG